jgi:N-acetylneuraminic acid mutarotase
MIIWGGSNGSSYLNTGARYNPTTDTWAATSTSNAPSRRSLHTGVWTATEMIVWGGYFFDNNGGHYLDTGGRYDPGTDSWTPTSTTDAPSARQFHALVWCGSEMIIWGGGFPVLNTGGRYNPATDSWAATSTTNAPEARYRHTAVWTGSEMIVWGGLQQHLVEHRREIWSDTGGHVPADAYGDTDNHAQAADTYTEAASHVSPSATTPVALL